MKQSRFFLSIVLVLCLFSFKELTAQQPFTAGNLVVLRVGDGSIQLRTSARPVFLDEYSPGGSLVQSIALPTVEDGANHMFTLNGLNNDDASSETGLLNLSPNGQWLTAAGYNASVLTIENDFLFHREKTIALINYNATINTSTKLTDAGDNHSYAAVTTNGIDLWACFSNSGIRYAVTGSDTSVSIKAPAFSSTYRYVGISNEQLYITDYFGRVGTVGTGLPTTGGQIQTSLPGLPALPISLSDQCQFFFADMNAGIPGNDVLYIAHINAGLQKYSFDGSTWIANGTVGTDEDNYFGITGKVNGSIVTLYSTRKLNLPTTTTEASRDGGGELVTLTDASGYNGTLIGTPTVLATAAFQTSIRGVAFAPQPPSVKVSVKAFLQGAYNTSLSRHKDVTTTWSNVLNANALTQPFNVPPFNYGGTEHVSTGFFTSTAGVTTDITDWVLLELRNSANPATVVSRRAAFIREDGQIVDTNRVSLVTMTAPTGVADGNYYIVVRHRNHLSVRSANPVALNGTTATLYDFTDNQNKAFQNSSITGNAAMATKDLPGTETGKFLLWGGNANGDGFIRASGASNVSDYLTLLGPLCLQGDFSKILNSVYRKEDMNLDGVVRASAALNVNDYITLLSTGILQGNFSNIITAH